MQNVAQRLTVGSNNYLVGSSPFIFNFKAPNNPDWTVWTQQSLTLSSIVDTYDNTARTDYAQVVKELIGGRPVIINLAQNASDPITFTSQAFADNGVALIPVGTVGIYIQNTNTTHYITGMIIATPGGINAYMQVYQ